MKQYILFFSIVFLFFCSCKRDANDNFIFPIFSATVSIPDSSSINVSLLIQSKGDISVNRVGVVVDTVSEVNSENAKSYYFDEFSPSSVLNIKQFFMDGRFYYVRPFAETPKGVVIGKVIYFKGNQSIIKKMPIINSIDGGNLHAIDTIYIKGSDFDLFKNDFSADYYCGYKGSYIGLKVKVVDKNNIKIFGDFDNSIDGDIEVNLKLNNNPILSRKFTLFKPNITNISYNGIVGDTLTIQWDSDLWPCDKVAYKGSFSKILKETKNSISLIPTAGNYQNNYTDNLYWNEKFYINNDLYYLEIPVKSPFEGATFTYNYEAKELIVKTKYEIQNGQYFISYLYYDGVLGSEFIDNYTLKLKLASLDDIQIPPLSGNVIAKIYLDNIKMYELNVKLKSDIGDIVYYGYNDFNNIDESLVIGDYFRFLTNYNGGDVKISNNSDKSFISYFDYKISEGSLAYDNTNNIYYASVVNDFFKPIDFVVLDSKLNKTSSVIRFSNPDSIQINNSCFYLNDKIYSVGYYKNSTGYNYEYKLGLAICDLKTKIVKISNVQLSCFQNGELHYDLSHFAIKAHNVNGNIFIDILSFGVKSIYRFNPNTESFEYFSDFPYNASEYFSYEFNNEWYVCCGKDVYKFNGNGWDLVTTLSFEPRLYFETSNARFAVPKTKIIIYKLY